MLVAKDSLTEQYYLVITVFYPPFVQGVPVAVCGPSLSIEDHPFQAFDRVQQKNPRYRFI